MGRTEPSSSTPPQSFRRAQRAKEARRTLSKVLPALLSTDARARRGVEAVELVQDPAPVGRDAFGNEVSGAPGLGFGGGGAGEGGAMGQKGGKGKGKGKARGKGTGRKKGQKGVVESEESEEGEGAAGYGGSGQKAGRGGPAEKGARGGKERESAPEQQELRIRIVLTDTLTAAKLLNKKYKAPARQDSKPATKPSKPNAAGTAGSATAPNLPHVSILNMASPLRPGGGFLSGATSQEEFLCMRTSLYASLHEGFYRLPETSFIWTPSVLVFRGSDTDKVVDLPRKERFCVSVVSGGMLRFPDVEEMASEGGDRKGQEGKVKVAEEDDQDENENEEEKEVEMQYANHKDRQLVEKKVRGVLRVMARGGSRAIVLGAWGCGAYGNPVGEVVKAFKKALVDEDAAGDKDGGKDGSQSKRRGKKSTAENLGDIQEVIFAINQRKLAEDFARYWGGDMAVEELERDKKKEEETEEEDLLEKDREELEAKLKEMEERASQSRFPGPLEMVIQDLKKQLAEIQRQLLERSNGNALNDSSDESPAHDSVGMEEDSDEDDDGDDDDDDAAYSSDGEPVRPQTK